MKLEKAINPLLDDDLLVAISYLFERILTEHLMNVESSWPFHHAVNKLRYKDYYDIVKTPMDLEKIKNVRRAPLEKKPLTIVSFLFVENSQAQLSFANGDVGRCESSVHEQFAIQRRSECDHRHRFENRQNMRRTIRRTRRTIRCVGEKSAAKSRQPSELRRNG